MPAVKGKEIRARRQRTGMKLGQFAKYADVGYKTLANIESGHQRYISIEVVYRVANALECEAEEILGEDEAEAGGAAA